MEKLIISLLFLSLIIRETTETVASCFIGTGNNIAGSFYNGEAYTCGPTGADFCVTLVSTNLKTNVINYALSCGSSCFPNSYNDGIAQTITSCCTTNNCNTYRPSSVVLPTVDSCYIGLGSNLGKNSSSGFYPSEIISCGQSTNAHYCITFITTNRAKGEIVYRQSCATVCKPGITTDPLTNIIVETTCCTNNNCNYFDFSPVTTTTRESISNLSCYQGVGTNISGIPSNGVITLCPVTASSYCKLTVTTNRISSTVSYSQSCASTCVSGTVLDQTQNNIIVTSCCSYNNCNFYQSDQSTTTRATYSFSSQTTINKLVHLACFIALFLLNIQSL